MFNKTIVNTPHTLQVRVDEHRAPTDDSIRLFSEYRDKAIQSVLDVGRESMSIDQVQWTVVEAPEIRGVTLYLTFFVDGRRCEETITLHHGEFGGSPESQCDAIKSRVQDRVIAAVSRELCKQLFVTMGGKVVASVVR